MQIRAGYWSDYIGVSVFLSFMSCFRGFRGSAPLLVFAIIALFVCLGRRFLDGQVTQSERIPDSTSKTKTIASGTAPTKSLTYVGSRIEI